MRRKLKKKPIVAVLLPIFLLLVVVFSIYQWNPLKADDQNTHLVDVKVDGKKVDDDFSVTDQSRLLETNSEKAQVLKFLESDKYEVKHLNEKGQLLPIKEVSNKELSHFLDLVDAEQKSTEETEETDQTITSNSESINQTSNSKEVDEIETQLFYVVEEGKKFPYLLMDKGETIWLSITNKKPEEDVRVTLEIPNSNKRQSLIKFIPKKIEMTDDTKSEENLLEPLESKESHDSSEKQNQSTKDSSSSSKNIEKTTTSSSEEKTKKSKTKKLTKEEKKLSLAIEKMLKEDYTEKDSFKPIELPAEEISSRESKDATSPISVTGAKMTIRDGTDYVDPGNDSPGYDSSFNNGRVRSFDSIIYLLTFSLEANDPTTTYSDIKYRVEMDLPNAYAVDSSGKQRFNAEVVDNDHGELVDTSATTKTSKGYAESTISANGQILLPMIVNVYGAQHNTVIKPNMKITIISAKNNKTGKVEEIDHTYDQSKPGMSELKLRETKVSAKASVKPTLKKGPKKPITDLVSGISETNWDVFNVGVTLGLTPISGRGTADFRGSTFPNGTIKLTIDSKSFYKDTISQTNGVEVETTISGGSGKTRPIHAIASSLATSETTDWSKHLYPVNTMNITEDFISMGIPNGRSEQIHSTEPNVSIEDKKKIGVYDTGNISVTNSGLSMTLSNSNYEPIYNPYTYTLGGVKTSDNEKLFSSSMMIVRWDKSYLLSKGTGVYYTNLNISSISYDGQTETVKESTTVSDAMIPTGGAVNAAVFTKDTGSGIPNRGLSSVEDWNQSNGDGKVGQQESNIYFGGVSVDFLVNAREIQKILRWNANSFEYDLNREIYSQSAGNNGYIESKTKFGVGKSQNHPSVKVSSKNSLESQYNWYSSPEEAVKHGKISAVKFFYLQPGDSFGDWSGVPIKVIGKAGSKDEFGNPNIGLSNSYWYDAKGNLIAQDAADNHEYKPTIFDNSGNVITSHNSYHGDTLFIEPFRIETTTTPEKPVYKTNETVKWKIQGNLLATVGTKYGIKLTTTLPKGLEYNYGSATDGEGVPLSDSKYLTVTNNSNGTTELIWSFSDVDPSDGKSIEVNFETRPSLGKLTFNEFSMANATVSTVGDMWLQSNPSQKDTSKAALRSSSGKIQLYQMQQIVLTKEVNKNFVEVGTNDSANSTMSNDITYKVTLENYSSDKLLDVKVIDELPYDGDDFGSDFEGSYTVKDIKITKGNGEITYTNNPVNTAERDDPNKLTGSWGLYVPGTSNVASIKDAKAFLISANELAVEDKLVFEITISPTGQNAGNLYRNRASFNSRIDLPVSSNIVQTQVLGRNLTGYVWYDDDYDGLIGTKKDGTPEDPVGDIPIKLYRTSLKDSSYKKQLVKESLTGEKFIDGSGNSLIKTKTSGSDKGKYEFKNLPEGEYIAEFMVGDLVVQKYVIVTKQLVGSDKTLNSKADPSDYKTPEYNQPELKDLPTLLTGTDKVHHVTDVNAGLTPLSKIRLFKYEKGTVIDSDGDGKLSDAEIEATGKPLANAEFNIYKGNSTNPADQIGDGKTNSQGWIRPEFTGLPPGDYTFVETKAPDGFELLKEPIKVTIPTYNYIATLHVSDDSQTKLPFTGGTKAMRIILIASAALFVIGMTGVFLHFRPIKVRGGK
ncbi:hypothetical protein AUF12_07600 [Enterococcus avium]|uniref:SpaA isopeptide-forming pilin-related protein n=1 Tax=Enterococcus avium TaxID=33945 RepID=UPI000C99B650|nr:SpaA isopeptide-forming pilin-related protein [Enterococcus avium]PNE50362.1 hypothetical protein AUF12_07600 [Enterococcus avium]